MMDVFCWLGIKSKVCVWGKDYKEHRTSGVVHPQMENESSDTTFIYRPYHQEISINDQPTFGVPQEMWKHHSWYYHWWDIYLKSLFETFKCGLFIDYIFDHAECRF